MIPACRLLDLDQIYGRKPKLALQVLPQQGVGEKPGELTFIFRAGKRPISLPRLLYFHIYIRRGEVYTQKVHRGVRGLVKDSAGDPVREAIIFVTEVWKLVGHEDIKKSS